MFLCCLVLRWSAIATHLPKRTDNEIKNYWNTHIKRKLYSRGIDPQTHRPLNAAAAATATATATTAPPASTLVPMVTTSNKKTINNNDSVTSSSKINHNVNNNVNSNGFQLVTGYGANTTKIGSDLVCEDSSNSSSGVTTEEQAYPHHHHHQLNLDLSIGLPSSSDSMNNDNSKLKQQEQQQKQEQPHVLYQWYGNVTGQGVCLCYGLGFQGNQACSCKGAIGAAAATVTTTTAADNSLYRFYRPMNI